MSSDSKDKQAGGGTVYRTRAIGPVVSVDKHMPVQALDPWSVIRFGYCSQEDAEMVWSSCLTAWGMGSSNKEMRMGVMAALAQAFCYSTSKDVENLATVVQYEGYQLKLATIFEYMSVYFQGSNDSLLRVFVRSFRKGTLVIMQYNLLNDPANAELRMEIAMRGDAGPEHAPFMFDTADTLVKAGVVLTYEQMQLVSRYRAIMTQKAMASAVSAGLTAPKNDVSSVGVRRPHQAAVSTTTQPLTQEQRIAVSSTSLR